MGGPKAIAQRRTTGLKTGPSSEVFNKGPATLLAYGEASASPKLIG